MFASGLITLREGLEAALIVGIVLGYLKQIGRLDRQKAVWAGVLAATTASIAATVVLQLLGANFEGRAEKIFEGTTMFLAVAVLTYMIFWMRYQGRHLRGELEQNVQAAVTGRQGWALAGLAFFAVFREGVETALFLSAAGFATDGRTVLLGGLMGLAIAIALGWLIFNTAVKIPLRRFFDVTSLLLLLFAAGLMAHGVHEFQEAGLLPTVFAPVWDINPILSETSLLGSLLKTLFGYNGNPSLLESFSYVAYWILVLVGVHWWLERFVSQPVGNSG
jgi:high-affinity iron transporter